MAWKSFMDLDVYKECRKFRKKVSEIVRAYFPPEEKWMLTKQILKSSRSVTAQIVEGHGRFHYQENIQFCRIGRGSLTETLEHLITAFDEKYISAELLKEMKIQYDKCMGLLNGYITYLEKKKQGD